MAKKKPFETDDFDFDAELDAPDFDFESIAIKDDRKPISKFKDGFIGGFKDTAVSPEFVKKVVKKSLPRGYGSAIDMADSAAGTLRNLYNSSAKEIKPAINELKKTTKRIVDATGGALPKSLAEKLKRWGESADEGRAAELSKEAQRESAIASELGSIFKTQIEQNAKQATDQDAKNTIRDGIEQMRHKDQMGQLGDMRVSLKKLSDYQDNVLANYHRKSLELQYRHYFVAVDMLEEQKRINAISETNLGGILKNTGLPDFVKMQNREVLKQVMRNKFLDALDDGIFGKRREFIRNLGDKASNAVKERVSKFTGDIRSGIDMANMMLEQQEAMKDFGGGPSVSDIAGNMAGSAVADNLGNRIGKRIGKWANSNQKIVNFGNKLQFGVENAPQLLGRWAREGQTPSWMPEKVAEFARDTIGSSLSGPETRVERDTMDNLQAPMPTTRQSIKSLTEIIPGLLSRIHREIKVLRTGDENTELITYDFTTGRFTEKSKAAKRAFNSLFRDGDKRGVKDEVDDLLKDIDPEGKLSAEQRQELGLLLLRMNMRNAVGDKKTLGDEHNYRSKHGGAYADLFNQYFDKDETGSKRLDFSKKFSRLGSSISDNRKQIQDLINNGLLDVLEDSGIVENGNINLDKVYAYNFNDTFDPDAKSGEAVQKARRFKGKQPVVTEGKQKPSFRYGVGNNLTPEQTPEPPQWAQQPEPVRYVGGQSPIAANKQLIEAIKSIDGNPAHKETNTILERIEKRLNEGVFTFGMSDVMHDGQMPKVNWLNKTVGQSIKDVFAFATKTAKTGFGKVLQARDRVMGAGKWAYDKAKDWGGKALDFGKEKLQRFRDVYVKGEIEPRLTAWKLKAGHYRDQATGKVIESIRDIKGAVIDENGNVVLSKEDLQNMFIKSRIGKAIMGFAGKVRDFAGGAYDKVKQLLPVAYQMGLDAVGKVLGMTIYRAEDVYVAGKPEPVLLARVMRAGGYRSIRTGEVIKHPGQIDSAVLDEDNNVVLSTEELRAGLLDKNGKPLRTGLGKITGAAKDAFKLGIGMVKKGWDKAKEIGSGMLGWLKKFALPDGILFSGGKTMIERLTEIRDLLDQRLPARKRKVSGDVNGDGVREGSYEDLMAKDKEKKSAADRLKETLSNGKDKAVGLGLGLKDMFSKFFKKKDEEGEEGEKDRSWLEKAADIADIADFFKGDGAGGKALGKGKGWLGRGANAAKGLGSRALGWGARGLGALTGLGGLGSVAAQAASLGTAGGLGSFGAAGAAGAGAAATGAAATGAATAGAATAATGAGAAAAGGGLLAGIGAVIGSPIFLTGLAIAGLGVAGYYGYKYLTRKKLDTLSEMRYAQYGFVKDDTEHLQQVFGLEDKLMKGVVWNGSIPDIDESKVNVKDVVESFGLSVNDTQALTSWVDWFRNRFKPVFMVHLAALRAVDPNATLDSVDSLKDEDKKKYFAVAKFADGPYNALGSPFKGDTRLKADASVVAAVIAQVQAKMDKIKDTTKTIGVAAVAPGLVSQVDSKSAAQGENKSPSDLPGIKDLKTQPGNLASANKITVAGSFGGFTRSNTGTVDALTVVRYKTYGLPEMVLEKVRALDMLEKAVASQVSYGKEGKASWSGDIDQICSGVGPVFGISGVNNENAFAWKSWFARRFLPTFLNYATVLYSKTNKADITTALGSLKLNDEVDLAIAIYSSKTGSAQIDSVWTIVDSPWPGFDLNTDVKSVEGNVQALKELAKKMVLDETKSKAASKGAGADNGIISRDPKKSFVENVAQTVKNAGSAAWEGVKSTYNAAKSFLGFGPSTAATNMQAAGNVVNHPGKGTGGDINDLPMPTGPQGKWDSVKELIIKAARMVGVDEKLLATMGAVESGFNWTVKAASSSATGLYQFISDTWKSMLSKFGPKYGIAPGTSPTDPRANALLGAEYLKANAEGLSKAVKRPLTDTDLYLAHFLGLGGAKTFLTADPNADAVKLMPAAANANPSIFFNADKSPRTVAQVYQEINNRVRQKGKQFGLGSGSEQVAAAPAPAAGAPSAASASAKPTASRSTAPAVNTTPVAGSDSSAFVGPMPEAPAEKPSLQIPVADQTAAVTSPKAARGYGSSASGNNAAVPSMSDAGADPMQSNAGFAPLPSRSQSLNAQAQYQREANSDILGPVSDTLKQSLGVQQNQLELLKLIYGVINAKGSDKPQTPASTTSAKPAFTAPQAPVSMNRS